MTSLFGDELEAPCSTVEEQLPSEEELGEAVVWGVNLCINKKYLGEPPASMTREDLKRELIEPTLKRCRRWRPGGKVILTKYAYVAACQALWDYMRKRHKAEQVELSTQDALIHAAAEFVLYADENHKFKLTQALFANLRARMGRDVFDMGVVTLEDFERVF